MKASSGEGDTLRRVDSAAPDVLAALDESIRQAGYVIVDGLSETARVLDLLAHLGPVVPPGVAMGPGMHNDKVYEVRVRNDGCGVADNHGNRIISTTPAEFALHTDGYNSSAPPRYVALFRTDSSAEAPVSSLADSYRLDLTRWRQLTEVRFPSAGGPVPIIEATVPQRIRFNPVETKRWAALSAVLPPHERAWIARTVDALSDALSGLAETFVLRRHDCLVLDNWRMCHGRSELAASSERVVQRIWVGNPGQRG
jgi:hypothetical protein